MEILDLKTLEESIVRLLESLESSTTITEAERQFYQTWRTLGCQLFEKHMQNQISGYEKSQGKCHQRWRRKYHTRLGSIQLSRGAYVNSKGMNCPSDTHLGLPENGWISTVEELACLFGIEMDFVHAAEMLAKTTGVEVSGHTLGNHVEALGQEMIQLQDNKPSAEIALRDSALKKTVGNILPKRRVYLGKDGVLVPLNQKQGYKEALVGVVFWEDSHIPVSSQRNEIRQRHYVATLESRDSFGEQLFKSFSYLVGKEPCQVIALGDGAHWIWEQVSLYYPDAIQILDFFHLSEYVWNVAKEVFLDKDDQKNWVNEQLTALKESRAHDVLSGLRFFTNRKALKVKDAVHRLKTYLQNNFNRIDYAKYLEMGLMIGSGVVESSNKRVVSQRLKQSGMHWSKQGANSVMALRAAYLSSGTLWPNFWKKRGAA